MTKIPVVFTFDKRIVLGAAVSVKSLIDCAAPDTVYDIYALHQDLSSKKVRELEQITAGTRHNLTCIKVKNERFKDAPSNIHSWRDIVYYRFLIPEVLPQIDKAIYSDVDVLFKDDLTDLYNVDIEDYELGAIKSFRHNPDTATGLFKENKKDFMFFSGLLLINCKKFRQEHIIDLMVSNAKKYYNQLKLYDSDLMNITCQKIKPVDLRYCVLQNIYYKDDYKTSKDYNMIKNAYSEDEILQAKRHPAIVHYAGDPGKPWRFKKPYEDYLEYMNKIPKSLRKLTFRDWRKRLFSKV